MLQAVLFLVPAQPPVCRAQRFDLFRSSRSSRKTEKCEPCLDFALQQRSPASSLCSARSARRSGALAGLELVQAIG